MSTEPVSVRVLDREYTVGVGDEERDSLNAAARVVDARMREVRGGNKTVSLDRLAVLTALNLAHELEQQRAAHARRERDLSRMVAELGRRLDELLPPG